VAELSITVVGRDRPGIIADVTGVLAELGLNLTDSTMTLLRGQFAMTLVCAGAADTAAVEAGLRPVADGGALVVTVRDVRPETLTPRAGSGYVLSVYGADRLGIVVAITRVLADVGGNITDLTTRLAGDLYLLIAEVDIPAGVDVEALSAELAGVAAALGVEAGLRPADPDLL
jgi:glycine cleavage system transcriptional repressor